MMKTRPTATLTEPQVIEVLRRLDAGEYQHVIAKDYGVSIKTISRIKTGETWNEVTQRFRSKHPLANITQPIIRLMPVKAETIDTIDTVIAIKNHFGFDFAQPIHWGWFDGWDGLHAIASDGIILWESTDLVHYAQHLAESQIDAHPVWANRAEELPTFDLEDIMTLPVGDKFDIELEIDGIAKLTCNKHQAFIQQRFINIARKMKLDIRVAGKQEHFVYLTKQKPKSPLNTVHVVIACLATMTD